MKLIAIFIALNALDILLTLLVVGNGGIELNPIMAHILSLGILPAVALKTVGALVIALLAVKARRIMALRICTLGMAAVCTFNLCGVLISP